ARVAAFGVVDRFAVRTFAPAGVIVLRDRNDFCAGRFAQPFFDLLDHVFAQFWIGEAKLGGVVSALAFDEAEPFGMRRKMFLRRDERVKGVTETFVINATAEVFGNHPAFVVGGVVR